MQNKLIVNLDTGEVTGNVQIKNIEEFLGQQLADFILQEQELYSSEVLINEVS